MKRLLIIGLILTGLTSQAFSMGHPHNMFAAHKRMHAKLSTRIVKPQAVQAVVVSTVVEKGSTALVQKVFTMLAGLLPTHNG